MRDHAFAEGFRVDFPLIDTPPDARGYEHEDHGHEGDAAAEESANTIVEIRLTERSDKAEEDAHSVELHELQRFVRNQEKDRGKEANEPYSLPILREYSQR